MHPVLVYSIVFIAITIGLLFVFERYQLGSIYLLLLISSFSTFLLGKFIIRLFPSEDPMLEEIQQEQKRVHANQYTREIRILFNVVQPDPKLQPSPKRIVNSLEDCFELDAETMRTRLKHYFGDSFNVSTTQPLVEMIEEIKTLYKAWPESK